MSGAQSTPRVTCGQPETSRMYTPDAVAPFLESHGHQMTPLPPDADALEERRSQEEVCALLNGISLHTLQRDQAEALDLLAQL